MISLDDETATPEVWAPVANGVDKPDELPLIRSEGAVSRCNGPAEERDWMALLNKHSAEPVCRCIALHGESLGEV
jgi:hypothetical protein